MDIANHWLPDMYVPTQAKNRGKRLPRRGRVHFSNNYLKERWSRPMSYALYKFHKAILSLHGTDLQKKQWLASSYMHHIVHLRDVDLPEPLREEFQDLRNCLTRPSESGADTSLEDTVSTLNNLEVNIIIDRIVDMYDMIRRYEGMPVSSSAT